MGDVHTADEANMDDEWAALEAEQNEGGGDADSPRPCPEVLANGERKSATGNIDIPAPPGNNAGQVSAPVTKAAPALGKKKGLAVAKKTEAVIPSGAVQETSTDVHKPVAPPVCEPKTALEQTAADVPEGVLKQQSQNQAEGASKGPKTVPKKAALAVAPKCNVKQGVVTSKKAGDKDSGEKKARGKSAYMYFQEQRRVQIKGEQPELSQQDIIKLMAAEWKELSDEGKAPFMRLAAGDKERADKENKEKGLTKDKVSRPPSAFMLYCNATRGAVKEEHPAAKLGDIQKLLSTGWATLSTDEKQKYDDLAAAARTQWLAAHPEAAAKKVAPRKRLVKAVAVGGDEGDAVAGAGEVMPKGKKRAVIAASGDSDDEEEDWQAEHQNVDWTAHAAEAIMSASRDGKLLVKRKGLPLTQFGMVDANRVKKLRLEAEPACPVQLPLLEEYEAFCNKFKAEVGSHMIGGDLDLEDLSDNSLLESCFWLGILRESGQELSSLQNGKGVMKDVFIRVPLLGTSRVVQRMIQVERVKVQALEAELAVLKKQGPPPAQHNSAKPEE